MALSAILKFFRKLGFVDLPIDARTLLDTPTFVDTRIVPPGEYWHSGFVSSLKRNIANVNLTQSVIEVKFS